MTMQEQYIQRLKELTISRFGRTITTMEDCEALSDDVFNEIGIKISPSSLEQLFCSKMPNMAPRPATISTLARYLGYGSWSDFCTARDIRPAEDTEQIPVTHRWGVILLTALAVVVVVVTAIMLLQGDDDTAPDTGEVATEVVDTRFTIIEEEWRAAATEHCNALREYYNEKYINEFIAHAESVNSEFIAIVRQNAYNDIAHYAATNNITVDNATIEQTANAIVTACELICNNLVNEARDIAAGNSR